MFSAVLPKLDLLHNDTTFYKNFQKSVVKFLPRELRKVDLSMISFPHWSRESYKYNFSPFELELQIDGINHQLSQNVDQTSSKFIKC